MSSTQTSDQYASLIFNRCKFFHSSGDHSQVAIQPYNNYFDKLIFDHCEWKMNSTADNREFYNADWTRINTSQILASVYQGVYLCDTCTGSPDINNYVTTATEGYGQAYSDEWYVQLPTVPVGYFDGYVMEEGGPVQRTINLYKRTNGEFLGTTSSNPSGYYYIETTFSGMHYVVCLDAPADPLYNDLIIGSAYPTAL